DLRRPDDGLTPGPSRESLKDLAGDNEAVVDDAVSGAAAIDLGADLDARDLDRRRRRSAATRVLADQGQGDEDHAERQQEHRQGPRDHAGAGAATEKRAHQAPSPSWTSISPSRASWAIARSTAPTSCSPIASA